MMKSCSLLLALFLTGIMFGCGGAPTPVEIPESEDTAVEMSEDEIEAELEIPEPEGE